MPQDVTRGTGRPLRPLPRRAGRARSRMGRRRGPPQHDSRLTRWDDASYQARVKFVDAWLARCRTAASTPGSGGTTCSGSTVSTAGRPRSPGSALRAVSALHDMLLKDYAPSETGERQQAPGADSGDDRRAPARPSAESLDQDGDEDGETPSTSWARAGPGRRGARRDRTAAYEMQVPRRSCSRAPTDRSSWARGLRVPSPHRPRAGARRRRAREGRPP